jgi:hypothetical protein
MNNSTIAMNKLKHIGNPITTTIAWISIVLNAVVVWTLIKSYKQTVTKRSSSQGQVHLLFLAISDITIGAAYAFPSIWLLFINKNDCDESFVLHFKVWYCFLTIVITVNKVMTVFITAKRAQGVFSIAQSLNVLKQTTKDNVVETFVIGIVGALILAGTVCVSFWLTYFEANKKVYFDYDGYLHLLFIIFEIVLTVFILYKIGKNLRVPPNATASEPAFVKEYQKLIIAVAVVFCFTQIAIFSTDHLMKIGSSTAPYGVQLLSVTITVNSSINIVIYLTFSSNFRKICCEQFCMCFPS